MKITDLKTQIQNIIGSDNKPVVIYSALWPLMDALELPPENVAHELLELLIEIVGPNRSLIMPTFAKGYQDGVCNLDTEPSSTGSLTELFRQHPKSQRSLSAFFTFSIIGPSSEVNEFINLKPENAWGDHSAYHWMEEKDVHFLSLATPPGYCSYLHRMEWLIKDKLTYRYIKKFNGSIIRDGNIIPMQENLYVRSLDPTALVDTSLIGDRLLEKGLGEIKFTDFSIFYMCAQDMKKAALSLLEKDPFIFLQNREDFEKK